MKITRTAIHASIPALFLLLTLSFIACKKGDKGDPGPAGANGNANVIGTNTVTLYSSNWGYDPNNDYYYAQLNVPSITQDVVDRGLVMLYFQENTGVWAAMPITFNNGVSLGFYITLNTIQIDLYKATFPNSVMVFRAVVVPASARQANPNIDWFDYQQVSRLQGTTLVDIQK